MGPVKHAGSSGCSFPKYCVLMAKAGSAGSECGAGWITAPCITICWQSHSGEQITTRALCVPAIKEEQLTLHCWALTNTSCASGTAPGSLRQPGHTTLPAFLIRLYKPTFAELYPSPRLTSGAEMSWCFKGLLKAGISPFERWKVGKGRLNF